MRTLARTLEYLALVAMMGGLTYYGAGHVGQSIGDSLNASAELIAHPERAGR